MGDHWREEFGARGGPSRTIEYANVARRSAFAWILLIVSLAVGCGGSDSTTAPPEEETEDQPDRIATSIELLTDSVRPMGMLGMTFQARARGRNAAGEVIPSKQETWSTDTPEILEVTPEGNVTSLIEGAGRVIARLDGVEAMIRVPVGEVARLEWQDSLGEIAQFSPTIGLDGTVYVTGTAIHSSEPNRFWAFDPGGAVRWSLVTSVTYEAAAIGADGTLYVGTLNFGDGEAELMALGPDGTTRWQLPRTGSIGLPVLGEDGTVHALEREGPSDDAVLTLLAVDAGRGELMWEHRIEGQQAGLRGALAVAPDNTVYFRTRDGVVRAVSGEGEPLWTVRLGDEEEMMESALAVGEDGTIYGGTEAGRLYALSPEDGSVRWALDLGYPVRRSVALGRDGTIYQTVQDALHAISPGGDVLWTWRMEGFLPASASPVIGGDRTVYVGARRGLFAIRPDGRLKWDFPTDFPVLAAPAIGLDGMVYAISTDGMLHAIRELEENNGGFDASPWPVWRGNRQNTGRAAP